MGWKGLFLTQAVAGSKGRAGINQTQSTTKSGIAWNQLPQRRSRPSLFPSPLYFTLIPFSFNSFVLLDSLQFDCNFLCVVRGGRTDGGP